MSSLSEVQPQSLDGDTTHGGSELTACLPVTGVSASSTRSARSRMSRSALCCALVCMDCGRRIRLTIFSASDGDLYSSPWRLYPLVTARTMAFLLACTLK